MERAPRMARAPRLFVNLAMRQPLIFPMHVPGQVTGLQPCNLPGCIMPWPRRPKRACPCQSRAQAPHRSVISLLPCSRQSGSPGSLNRYKMSQSETAFKSDRTYRGVSFPEKRSWKKRGKKRRQMKGGLACPWMNFHGPAHGRGGALHWQDASCIPAGAAHALAHRGADG